MNVTDEEKALYTKTVLGAIPGFGLMLVFWFVATWVNDYRTFIVIVVGCMTGWQGARVMMGRTDVVAAALNVFWVLFFMIMAHVLNEWLGGRGLYGFLLVTILLTMLLLWRRRRVFMAWIRHLETRLYGAPLDEIRRQKK